MLKKFIIALISLLPLISLILPSPAFAAITSYKITDAIPPQLISPPSGAFTVFITKTFTLNYSSGDVWLSSTPDGLSEISIDDGYTMTIFNPNGVRKFFGGLFETNCGPIIPKPPQNIKSVLGVGVNNITIELKDFCGGFKASTPLYLTYNDPTLPQPTPTPSPTPTPTPIPTPTPTPIPTPTPKTPLIFIPGFGGSELQTKNQILWDADDGHGGTYTHLYPENDIVWVNSNEAAKTGNDDYFDILKMDLDGTSTNGIEPTGNVYDGYYGETINFFNSNGYTKDQDFFVFAYDWRKDISLTTPLLDQRIDQIRNSTGSEKVDIVAHSTGGLVARNYIKDPPKANKIRKLIELGVPHLGTAKFIKARIDGECLTKPELENLPICLGLSQSEVKDILQNTISGFELSPSQAYFDFYTGGNIYPRPFADLSDVDHNEVVGELDYVQTKSLLTNIGQNTSLFTPAEIFHQIDNLSINLNGIQTMIITGSGKPTIGQIVEKNILDLFGIRIPKKDLAIINGDETVPLYSSSLTDKSRNISLAGTAINYYTKQSHSGLVENGPALDLAKNFLKDQIDIPEGIQTEPFLLKGKQVSVHSPVKLDIYDQNGNHTGLNKKGDTEENIPNSLYYTMGEAKFIWLPDDGTYQVKLIATDHGSFDLKIKSYEHDLNNQTILFKNIPIENSTKAETSVNTNSLENTILELDRNGDGINETEKNPDAILAGNGNYDTNPPSIFINNPVNNETFILNQPISSNFNCTDENSGIDNCSGTISNGENLDTSSTGSKQFRVFAEDKAGNTTIKTNNYKVIYTNSGLCKEEPTHLVLSPIKADGTSIFKQGSTVPIKFRVCDHLGNSINSNDLVTSFKLIKTLAGTTISEITEQVLSTNPDSNFRWDPQSQQWIFNLSTKNLQPSKTYFYRIELNDGSNIEFSFGLR